MQSKRVKLDLEGLLNEIFWQASLGYADGEMWQLAYKECFDMCTDYKEQQVYDMVCNIVKNAHHAPFKIWPRHIVTYMNNAVKRELYRTFWILKTLPKDIALGIFIACSSSRDFGRGVFAVYAVCEYLKAYWVQNNQKKWSVDLIYALNPDIRTCVVDNMENICVSVTYNDDMTFKVLDNGFLYGLTRFCRDGDCNMIPLYGTIAMLKIMAEYDGGGGGVVLETLDKPMLLEVINFANYMRHLSLLDACCRLLVKKFVR